MKKLISVFAALALVGSLAAQKGKKPAKAPAKPAVAAPAVPAAVTTAAAIAPAAGGMAKGMGLFIDLRGAYTLANGSSASNSDGANAETATATTAVTYKTPGAYGIGGGATIGYDIAANLGLVASFDVRLMKSREFKNRVSAGGGFADTTTNNKWTNMVIGVGLQPHVNALGGQVFGGAGVAIVLPYETTQTTDFSNGTATFNTNTGTRTKTETVHGYNLGIGAYGEVGYRFFFTDNIGLVLGVRALVVTVDDKDKTEKVTNTASTTTTTTTTYGDSLSTTDTTAVTVGNDTTQKAKFNTQGITDIQGTVGIALRF